MDLEADKCLKVECVHIYRTVLPTAGRKKINITESALCITLIVCVHVRQLS